uniref:Uncharacterized protein n=1 Tax=Sus scrofa TaxID=9823 RepID=A0A8D1G1S0_PIG
MSYRLTAVRMATTKKNTNNKCWRRCGEKGILLPRWGECKLDATTMQKKKKKHRGYTKNRITIGPSNSTPGYISEKNKNTHSKGHPNVHSIGLFTISKTWKPPKCPSRDEWIKKIWYRYTMEYYKAIKKE